MEKISLKLYEFYNLDSELNGVVNQQNGEKISAGLLSEKLKLTKFTYSLAIKLNAQH